MKLGVGGENGKELHQAEGTALAKTLRQKELKGGCVNRV